MTDNLAERASHLQLGGAAPLDAAKPEIITPAVTSKIIDRGHYRARDITDDFFEASKALQTGQLVKHETFTLFESVSALEIMDPKMDSGMQSSGEDLDEFFDTTQPLLPEEILGIIDQIFCYEMAWLEGYPLSQTLFTSLHIDKILDSAPKTLHEVPSFQPNSPNSQPHLNDSILRAYCLAVIKTCDLVLKLITAQHQEFYEEEDFVRHTCNRELFPDIPTSEFICCLQYPIEKITNETEGDDATHNAILNRLVCRIMVLEGLDRFSNILPLDNDGVKVEYIWKRVKQQTSNFLKEHELGKPVPLAFSGKVQRKLASTVPPRPVIEKSFDEATKQFTELCEDILSAHEALSFQEDDTSEDVLTFLWNFNSRVPQPNTLARAILQNLLYGTDRIFGIWAVEELIIKELQEFLLTNDWFIAEENWQIEAPNHPRYHAARLVDEFLGYAVPAYGNIFRALCQNRCRVRRNFQHIIQDFDRFEDRAEKIDIQLREYANEKAITALEQENCIGGLYGLDLPSNTTPLRTWTQHTKTRIMEWFVQLGFEQELYKAHELANVYKILCNISFLRGMNIDTAVNLINIHADRVPIDDGGAQTVLMRRRMHGSMRVLESSFVIDLSFGLFMIYTILMRLSIIESPVYPYSNDALRLAIRIKPFEKLTEVRENGEIPIIMTSIEPDETIATLLTRGERALLRQRNLKNSWKMIPESGGCRLSKMAWDMERKAYQMSFVATSVALAKLKKAIETWGEARVAEHVSVTVPGPQERYHGWWIVPKITEK